MISTHKTKTVAAWLENGGATTTPGFLYDGVPDAIVARAFGQRTTYNEWHSQRTIYMLLLLAEYDYHQQFERTK